MRKIKKNKGFTLIELIVVIAIIGILAAVLIPSISGYINKAHRGRDVELAGHMTTELTLYATEYNVNMDDLTGVDVRTILSFSGQNLIPRKDKWVFAYDRTTHQVVVKDIDEGSVLFAAAPDDPIDPTHIEENFYLISKGNTAIEQAVELMTNLETVEDYRAAMALVEDSIYSSIIEKFNPDTTLFIGNGGAYTTADGTDNKIKKIVVLEQTSCLPKLPSIVIGKDGDDEDIYGTYLDFLDEKEFDSGTIFSNTIRTSEPNSQLKNLFKGVPDIDLSKVKTIDLAAFGTNASGATIYKMEMGPHIKDSFKQVISDEIISINEKKDGVTVVGLIINRKLTISYYNKDGLFARGSVYYAVLQDKPTAPPPAQS
jgi:prepilin-type N-terminal cleavage/methylation domain-containing protein